MSDQEHAVPSFNDLIKMMDLVEENITSRATSIETSAENIDKMRKNGNGCNQCIQEGKGMISRILRRKDEHK